MENSFFDEKLAKLLKAHHVTKDVKFLNHVLDICIANPRYARIGYAFANLDENVDKDKEERLRILSVRSDLYTDVPKYKTKEELDEKAIKEAYDSLFAQKA